MEFLQNNIRLTRQAVARHWHYVRIIIFLVNIAFAFVHGKEMKIIYKNFFYNYYDVSLRKRIKIIIHYILLVVITQTRSVLFSKRARSNADKDPELRWPDDASQRKECVMCLRFGIGEHRVRHAEGKEDCSYERAFISIGKRADRLSW